MTGMPHEVIRDEHSPPLKCIQQTCLPVLANKRRRSVHLDHGEPSTGRCDRIACPGVRFFLHSKCIQLRLEVASIDYAGRAQFFILDVTHESSIQSW